MKQHLAVLLASTGLMIAVYFALPHLGFSPTWTLLGAMVAGAVCLAGGFIGIDRAKGSRQVASNRSHWPA